MNKTVSVLCILCMPILSGTMCARHEKHKTEMCSTSHSDINEMNALNDLAVILKTELLVEQQIFAKKLREISPYIQHSETLLLVEQLIKNIDEHDQNAYNETHKDLIDLLHKKFNFSLRELAITR